MVAGNHRILKGQDRFRVSQHHCKNILVQGIAPSTTCLHSTVEESGCLLPFCGHTHCFLVVTWVVVCQILLNRPWIAVCQIVFILL